MNPITINVGINPQTLAVGANVVNNIFVQMVNQAQNAGRQIQNTFNSMGVFLGNIFANIFSRIITGFEQIIEKSALFAARTQELTIALGQLATANGISNDAIRSEVNSITALGFSFQQAEKTITTFIQVGLKLSQASALARAAQDLAVLAGKDQRTELDQLTAGISTLQIRMLRTAGVYVSLQQETQKYAKANGVASNSISVAEKQQILLNAVLEFATRATGSYEASVNSAATQLRLLGLATDKAKQSIGDQLQGALMAVIKSLQIFLDLVAGAPKTVELLTVAIIAFALALRVAAVGSIPAFVAALASMGQNLQLVLFYMGRVAVALVSTSSAIQLSSAELAIGVLGWVALAAAIIAAVGVLAYYIAKSNEAKAATRDEIEDLNRRIKINYDDRQSLQEVINSQSLEEGEIKNLISARDRLNVVQQASIITTNNEKEANLKFMDALNQEKSILQSVIDLKIKDTNTAGIKALQSQQQAIQMIKDAQAGKGLIAEGGGSEFGLQGAPEGSSLADSVEEFTKYKQAVDDAAQSIAAYIRGQEQLSYATTGEVQDRRQAILAIVDQNAAVKNNKELQDQWVTAIMHAADAQDVEAGKVSNLTQLIQFQTKAIEENQLAKVNKDSDPRIGKNAAQEEINAIQQTQQAYIQQGMDPQTALRTAVATHRLGAGRILTIGKDLQFAQTGDISNAGAKSTLEQQVNLGAGPIIDQYLKLQQDLHPKKAKAEPTGTADRSADERLSKAIFDRQTQDYIASLDAQKQALERNLDDRKVSYEDYYTQLDVLAKKQMDAEIAEQENTITSLIKRGSQIKQEMSQTSDPKTLDKLGREETGVIAQIQDALAKEDKAKEQYANKSAQYMHEESQKLLELKKEYDDLKSSVEDYIYKALGGYSSVEGQQVANTQHFLDVKQKLIDVNAKLHVYDDVGLQDLIKQFEAAKSLNNVRLDYQYIETQIGQIKDAEADKESEINILVQNGTIGQLTAQQKVLDLHHQLAAQLAVEINYMEQMIALNPQLANPETLDALHKLVTEQHQLAQETDGSMAAIHQSIEQGLVSAITDSITQIHNLSQIWTSFATTVISTIIKIEAQRLVRWLLDPQSSGGSGGSSGGGGIFGSIASFLGPLLGIKPGGATASMPGGGGTSFGGGFSIPTGTFSSGTTTSGGFSGTTGSVNIGSSSFFSGGGGGFMSGAGAPPGTISTASLAGITGAGFPGPISLAGLAGITGAGFETPTFQTSFSEQAASQASIGSVIHEFGHTTGSSAVPATASSLFSLGGLSQLAQGLAPIIGLTAGVGLGGPSTTGKILGGIGGLITGLQISSLLAGAGLSGGLTGSLGALAALGTTIGLFLGPALLLGAYFLGASAQRHADERLRDEIYHSQIEPQFATILKAVQTDQMDATSASAAARQLEQQYYQAVDAQIKTKSVRNSARSIWGPVMDQKIAAIDAAGKDQTLRVQNKSHLNPEFASGGFAPGFDQGRDTVSIRVRPGELMIPPDKQTPAVLASAFAAGVPGFANGGFSPSMHGSGDINITIISSIGQTEFNDAWSETANSEVGRRITVKTIKRERRDGERI